MRLFLSRVMLDVLRINIVLWIPINGDILPDLDRGLHIQNINILMETIFSV